MHGASWVLHLQKQSCSSASQKQPSAVSCLACCFSVCLHTGPLANKAPFFGIAHVLIPFPHRRPRATAARKEADVPSQAGHRDCECLLAQVPSSPLDFKPHKTVYSQALSCRRCSQPFLLCPCSHAILPVTFLAVRGGIPASSKLQML